MKIAIICGTRPEAIKLIPVYQTIKNSGEHEVYLISTGQHKEMLQQIFDFFLIQPDIDLGLMTNNQSLAAFTARAIETIDKAITPLNLELILVQGDTTTAMAASMVGFYNQIKIGHVEAGLRTFEKYSPFPEEINRRIIGTMADYHFAPTQQAADNLTAEKANNVIVTGNTVIDSLLLCKKKIEQNKTYYTDYYKDIIHANNQNILVTGHRRESFGDGFQNICEAIKDLSIQYQDYSFIYPVHLNPNVREVVNRTLGGIKNIHLIDPIPYDHMVFLMSVSKLILTDSGGVQEEAPSLNIPVVVMRNHTERQEGVDSGCAILVGTQKEKIVEGVNSILKNDDKHIQMSSSKNPYGDGNASQIILDKINQIVI